MCSNPEGRCYKRLLAVRNAQIKHLFLMSLKDRAKRWFRTSYPNTEEVGCRDLFEEFKKQFYPKRHSLGEGNYL